MSPEAVRARTVMYGSPGSGWVLDSRPIRMSPDTELRSSQAGRLSATPTVKEPEVECTSTEPLVAETAISPDPELAGICDALVQAGAPAASLSASP